VIRTLGGEHGVVVREGHGEISLQDAIAAGNALANCSAVKAHLITVPWGYFYTLVRVEEGHDEGAFRQCDLTPPPVFPRSTLVDEVKFSAD
jgi:hypothetical protein